MATAPTPIAPQIDDPLALLAACHDKVRHFARLALRLSAHLQQAGPDKQAEDAAQAILRYFTMAAPLHHDDEAVDLFPALRRLNQPGLDQAMAELEAEHDALNRLWLGIEPWLQATQAGRPCASPAGLQAFVDGQLAHAQREDEAIYPHARQLAPEALNAIAAAMVARRSAPR